jgi:glutamate N-acetyltransferase/amino-acid N-acetyltransferase
VAVNLPQGFRAAGGSCGIKSSGDDLGLIVADGPSRWAGVFTQNAAAAAPVLWSRGALGRDVRALIVNSGNANACTGPEGEQATRRTALAVANEVDCAPEEVLVASTGPIGVPLPVGSIERAVPALFQTLGEGPDAFAGSILTTDTGPKVTSAEAGAAHVLGIAKGAAMIAPNMATMLAFVLTDADLDAGVMQSVLSVAVKRSFNRISVDACESTNDSVFLISSGRTACTTADFETAVTRVCRDLAEMIVRDAEGASKLVRIDIEGAPDDDSATELGRAVAASDLWRAASGGNDPNWGRILSALGTRDRSLDLSKVSVSIGDELLFASGAPCGDRSAAISAMRQPEFSVHCIVGGGPGASQVLTCDLTPDYVKLNAEGTT